MKAVFTIKDLKISQKNYCNGKRMKNAANLSTIRAERESSVKHDKVAGKVRLLEKIRMIQTRLFVRLPTNMSILFDQRSLKDL